MSLENGFICGSMSWRILPIPDALAIAWQSLSLVRAAALTVAHFGKVLWPLASLRPVFDGVSDVGFSVGRKSFQLLTPSVATGYCPPWPSCWPWRVYLELLGLATRPFPLLLACARRCTGARWRRMRGFLVTILCACQQGNIAHQHLHVPTLSNEIGGEGRIGSFCCKLVMQSLLFNRPWPSRLAAARRSVCRLVSIVSHISGTESAC